MFARAVLMGAGSVALALASPVRAGFFSFDSNHADEAWTFRGNGTGFNAQSLGASDFLALHVDDNNGVLPRLTFTTRFTANITMTFAGDVNLGGGSISHNYVATGNFSFVDVATNSMILTVTFTGALFTARGGSGTWGSTAALQHDNTNGGVTMVWTGTNLPGYSLTPGGISARELGFALDSINTSGATPYAGQSPGVGLNGGSMPNGTWYAEASFVAAIPAPAGLSLMGLAGVLAGRRRR